MNRNLFSRPRCNPRWAIKLARAIGSALRFVGNYSFYRTEMNRGRLDAFRKAKETHV